MAIVLNLIDDVHAKKDLSNGGIFSISFASQFFAKKAAPKIISICGSQRVGSFNKMLHDHAVSVMEQHGAVVTPVDLESLNLPLYNPNDEEQSFPDSAVEFKEALTSSGTKKSYGSKNVDDSAIPEFFLLVLHF